MGWAEDGRPVSQRAQRHAVQELRLPAGAERSDGRQEARLAGRAVGPAPRVPEPHRRRQPVWRVLPDEAQRAQRGQRRGMGFAELRWEICAANPGTCGFQ